MMDYQQQQEKIKAAIEGFPKEFALRGFPGEKFCLSQMASYCTMDGVVMLYTSRWSEEQGRWLSFAKGTAEELQREVQPLPEKE